MFEAPLPAGSYRNPILAGFYPDPSVTRAGDKFYLVNSTFAYFPGIPVFESSDLVHWRLLGHVIDRPSQLRFDGLGISRGVFAPAIHYHDGTFYVSEHAGGQRRQLRRHREETRPGPGRIRCWLPEIDGIDPSLFFDDDGRAYVLNNGRAGRRRRATTAIARSGCRSSTAAMKLFGPRKVLMNGGVDISKKPIWIEGPHVFKRDGWYYLDVRGGRHGAAAFAK